MAENAVRKMEEPVPLAPGALLERAVISGASIEVIERLVALQERREATEARKAFNAAITAFKAEAPSLLKTVEVAYEGRSSGNRTSYKHEDLAKVLEAVDKAAAEHGLWVRYKCHNQGPDDITVTCVLGHESGYVEDAATLSAKADTTGNKNAIQAIGSAVTYLQRYTLKVALGLAAARDDDGRASGPGSNAITTEQAAQIDKVLQDNKHIDMDKFLQLAGAASVAEIMAVKYDSAMQWLNRQAKKAVKK